MEFKKKLIEVALPLEEINKASRKEKHIRHGHPSTLHYWWARRPLAACRAVLFASVIDDPSNFLDLYPTEKDQQKERERLFGIIRKIVEWENTNDTNLFDEAKKEILKHTNGVLPVVFDPFCGGGSIPLEAQRLGLESYASDLNPVAVLITKSMIEIPGNFNGRTPINPGYNNMLKLNVFTQWSGAKGLAEDVRYYGDWMLNEAKKRIGKFYSTMKLPDKYGGHETNVIGWFWTRTVKCPNPACGAQMPLIKSFYLSNKDNKKVWINPLIDQNTKTITYEIKSGEGKVLNSTVGRTGAKCIFCGTAMKLDYIRKEGKEQRLNSSLVAVALDGSKGRIYIPAHELEMPENVPNTDFLMDLEAAEISGYFNPPLYGYTTIGSMFNDRQRFALKVFSDLVLEAKRKCIEDGADPDYATAIGVYLTLGVGRLSNRLSMFSIWNNQGEKIEHPFSEQGVSMVWDYIESNPFSGASGSWESSLEWIPKCIERFPLGVGKVFQRDAARDNINLPQPLLISTDPPYYSSLTYADFSDYFYGVFRNSLKKDFPDIFSTLATPKTEEAIAAWHRFGGNKKLADEHFRAKLRDAIKVMVTKVSEDYPITIFYAFKEKDMEQSLEKSFTAWESILSVIIDGGLQIVHTWPLRTERTTGRKAKKNSLASSIVLVCRKRSNSGITTRREFVKLIKKELPLAIKNLQVSNIPPIDLAQASIGPGMSVFTRFEKILEADGNFMTVRTALKIINQELETSLEGEMDSNSSFCVAWYEQFGMNEATFGEADVLARAKNTSVGRLEEEGVVYSAKGKVRLLKRDELEENWSPVVSRNMIWMCSQQIVKALENGGEEQVARLIYTIKSEVVENAKELAYRLYAIAERKGWTEEAYAYNALIVSWPDIQKRVVELASFEQQSLF